MQYSNKFMNQIIRELTSDKFYPNIAYSIGLSSCRLCRTTGISNQIGKVFEHVRKYTLIVCLATSKAKEI